MRRNELKFRNKKKIRRGRGNASGRGTYSGKGVKGQKARSGYRLHSGFEGGQTPLYQRLPKKRGGKNLCKKKSHLLKLSDLERQFEAGDTVSREQLKTRGLLKDGREEIKILGNGEISKPLTVKVSVSKSAQEKIEKAGGKVDTNN